MPEKILYARMLKAMRETVFVVAIFFSFFVCEEYQREPAVNI